MTSNRKSTFPVKPRYKNKNKNKKVIRVSKVSTVSLPYTVENKTITVSFPGGWKHSFRINASLWESFKNFSHRLGKTAGEALIEAILEYIQNHAEELPSPIVINIFRSGSKQVNIDLSRRLELKLVKTDLTLLIQTLEAKKGDQNFFKGKLKELLPKALRIYKKTSDPEIEDLLKRTEKWM